MTAQSIQIDSEVETAIREKRLTEIKLTKARFRLSDGVLSLRAQDLLPPQVLTEEEVTEAKTNKMRQQEFAARRKEAGFARGWIHQSLERLADEAGGQEQIENLIERTKSEAADLRQKLAAAEARAQAAEAELQRLRTIRRPWWKLW